MKKTIIYLYFGLLLIGFLSFILNVNFALADDPTPTPTPVVSPAAPAPKDTSFSVIDPNELVLPNYTKISTWENLGVKVIDIMLKVAGTLLLLVLLISGVMYITSAGDEAKAEKAKKAATGAIIGIAAIAASWGIFTFIQNYWK